MKFFDENLQITLVNDENRVGQTFFLIFENFSAEKLIIKGLEVPSVFIELNKSLEQLINLSNDNSLNNPLPEESLLQHLIFNKLVELEFIGNDCLIKINNQNLNKKSQAIIEYIESNFCFDQDRYEQAIGVPWFAGEEDWLYIGYIPERSEILLSQTSKKGLGSSDLWLNKKINLTKFKESLQKLSSELNDLNFELNVFDEIFKKLDIISNFI